MLGIIICGHGGFASGLNRAMLQILGEQEAVIAIDFPESSTTALLQAQCEAALAEIDKGDGVVFLTDLLKAKSPSGAEAQAQAVYDKYVRPHAAAPAGPPAG